MREKGLRVERLMDTGRWYRERFATTPATAVCALEPFGQRNAQSIWYDCKNYRANLYHDQRGARIRDLFFSMSAMKSAICARCAKPNTSFTTTSPSSTATA